MRKFIGLCAIVALAACGSKTATSDGADVADDAATGSDAVGTDAIAGTDATSAPDTKLDGANDVFIPSCASRAGAYAIDGTCTGGASSITFGCMRAKDCNLTWVGDYRTWSGTLKGNDFTLASTDGSENFSGSFDSASNGFYHYDNGSLTCDATVTYVDPTQADSLCCDVLANDCKTGDACVVVAETPANTPILTTGCVPLAASPTAEGNACTQSATETGCAAGSLCVRNTGSAGSDGTCQHLCQQVSDCKAGLQCDIVSDAPRAGICDTACAPFADEAGGTTCPIGQNCLPTLIAGGNYVRAVSTVCGTSGTATAGQPCSATSLCGGGLVCIASACTPICDTKHPCATGACTGFGLASASGIPAGFGFCK